MVDPLSLNASSDVPIYQQIVSGLEKAILNDLLKAGDYLPSVREFSMKYQVNPNTVSKAYQVLQGLGLVEPVRGMGLKVRPLDHRFSNRRKKEILAESIDELLKTAASLQISNETLLQEIRSRMKSNKMV